MSRIDGARAYRHVVRRVTAAVVTRAVDTSPSRRPLVAVACGLGVALVLLAVAALLGATSSRAVVEWRRANAVLVEKETGARYVLVDGVLHPVANYASARLVTGTPAPVLVPVSRHDLATVARGVPLGIAGAPDSIPVPADLVVDGWTACSDATLMTGDVTGRPLASHAILVVTPDGAEYLIRSGRRARVRDPAIVLSAFGWTAVTPVPVPSVLIAALSTGPDLARIAVDRRGHPSRIRGVRVGAVVTSRTESGLRRFAVVLADGLADISPLVADVLLNDPTTPGPGRAIEIAARTFASAPHRVLPAATGWPEALPVLERAPHRLCVPVGGSMVLVDVPAAVGVGAISTGPVRVLLPPGRGALVRAGTGPVVLITDQGIGYPVEDADALSGLGYGGVAPVVLPAGVLALVPHGVRLSRAAARAPLR